MDAGAPDVRRVPPSGPARHVRHVIAELRRLGHDVRLLARLDDGVWVSDDLEHYRRAADIARAGYVERALRRTQRLAGAPYAAWFDSRRFASACERELAGVDVIYERMGWMGLGGSLAAKRMSVPHVLEVNGDHVFELEAQGMEPGPAQRAVSTCLMRRMVRRANASIATGDGWRARHIARWRPDPATVLVVPNGTDMVDVLSRTELRAFGESATGTLRVLFIGAFDPWQGLPLIVGAVAQAVARGADLELTLAGAGALDESLRADVAARELGGRVRFAGFLEPAQLARRLAASDVGVAAYGARGEFSGLKLLDYKAAGLLTVTTGAGGQPPEIKDGWTGLVVPEGGADAFAEALIRCARDRDLVRRLGRQARLEAETDHAWSVTARRIAALLEGVIRPTRDATAVRSALRPTSSGLL